MSEFMTIEWFREESEKVKALISGMVAQNAELKAKIAALTELVRRAEWSSENECPWCMSSGPVHGLMEEVHSPTCPARPFLTREPSEVP